jgi:hypothetical protein
VGYPDDSDFIIRFNNRILGYHLSVPGYDYVQWIYTLFDKDLFDRSRAVVKNPTILDRIDEFHALGVA